MKRIIILVALALSASCIPPDFPWIVDPVCPAILIECEEGEPVDTNFDGCVDSCGVVCYDDSYCNDNEFCQVSDGRLQAQPAQAATSQNALVALVGICTPGCIDRCVSTCEYAIDCAPGSVPVDINGDGCDDLCEAATCDDVEIECEDDQISIDSDGEFCAPADRQARTDNKEPIVDWLFSISRKGHLLFFIESHHIGFG